MKEKGETLNHLPKNAKDGNQKESKKKESLSTVTSQMKGSKIVKSMGEVAASHLKEIKELEIVIETPRRSEKDKETKQRPQNTRRSVTERTRKAEKKEKLKRDRAAEKEADRNTSRENLLSKRRGRELKEEGEYSLRVRAHTGSEEGGVNDTTDKNICEGKDIEYLDSTLNDDKESTSNVEPVTSKAGESEGSTTNSRDGNDDYDRSTRGNNTNRQSSHKIGKKDKSISKSQVKKNARREKVIDEQDVEKGPDKYKLGEVSSRRKSERIEKGLIELVDADGSTIESEPEGKEEQEGRRTNEQQTKNRFWATPPR